MSKTDPVRFDHGVTIYPPGARNMWRIVYRDRHGQRRNTWRKHWDDARAAALHIAQQLDQVDSRAPDEANAARPFDALAAAYLADNRDHWSASHAGNLQSDYRLWIAPHLADQPCSHIGADQVSNVLRNVRDQGVKPDQVHATLRAMTRYGLARGYFTRDPLQGVTVARAGRRRQGQSSAFVDHHLRPDTDSVERLADQFASVTGQWWRGLEARMAAYTGLRWGELHELRPTDIDLSTGDVAVERQVIYPEGRRHLHLPKYRKVRETFLPGFLTEATERRVKELEAAAPPNGRVCTPQGCGEAVPGGGGPLLFPSPTGCWPQPSRWHKWFRHACEHAGWPRTDGGEWRWDWHSLRHHAATWMLAAPPDGLGLEVADVSWFLGHATPAFTHAAYVYTRRGAVERARRASGAYAN